MPKKSARGDLMEEADEQTATSSIELDLEGFTPYKSDSDGITVLLKHLFSDPQLVNAPDLADYIVAHSSCATVVKPASPEEDDEEDDEDEQQIIFALTTLVDLSPSEASKHKIIHSLRQFIRTLIDDSTPVSGTDKQILLDQLDCQTSPHHLFLFINERFENLPLSISADAIAALPSEAKEANLTPTHLLLLTRAHRLTDRAGTLDYAYPEIEHILPFCQAKLEVPCPSHQNSHNNQSSDTAADEDGDMLEFNTYLILLVSMDRFGEIIDTMRSHL